MSIKELILQAVEEQPGIKGAVLACTVSLAAERTRCGDDSLDFVECLDILIAEKKIVEVQYVLPTMSYRVKSMFFPAGTQIL